jgi:hypothetical protein
MKKNLAWHWNNFIENIKKITKSNPQLTKCWNIKLKKKLILTKEPKKYWRANLPNSWPRLKGWDYFIEDRFKKIAKLKSQSIKCWVMKLKKKY